MIHICSLQVSKTQNITHCQGFSVTDLNNWQFHIRRIGYEFHRTSEFHAFELEKQSYIFIALIILVTFILNTLVYHLWIEKLSSKISTVVINVDS